MLHVLEKESFHSEGGGGRERVGTQPPFSEFSGSAHDLRYISLVNTFLLGSPNHNYLLS